MIKKEKIVVLSGAGISTESGIPTFRDSNGLWENHRIEEVASPEGFSKNPQLVLDFYNKRRQQLKEVKPNRAHELLAKLERYYEVTIVTQNVDDLHERANSQNVIHLHGELRKVRPEDSPGPLINWTGDLNLGDTDERGVQIRPHIVWFGESVPMMKDAIFHTNQADILIIIGTSMQVNPAASLIHYVPNGCQIFVIDPHLSGNYTKESENHYALTATEGMALVYNRLTQNK